MAEEIDTLTRFLDDHGVAYELVEHGERFTAAGEAQASGVGPQDAAKDVVLRRGGEYVLALIPASERLDLSKVRDLIGAGNELRLATEEEIAADFPGFAVGALPPFGPIFEVEEIVDRRLLDHERVLCNGGDHSHSVKVDPNEIVRVSGAQVGDLSQD
jgi:Ala-tRNA(Pro) deacylase